MKFNLNKLVSGKTHCFEYDESFEGKDFKYSLPLNSIKSTKITVSFLESGDVLTISIKGEATVNLKCCYTLKDFDKTIKIDESNDYSLVDDGGDLEFIGSRQDIEVDDFVYDAIASSIPMEVHIDGASLPSSENNYRILTEDEYRKEKEEKTDSRFDKLKDLFN